MSIAKIAWAVVLYWAVPLTLALDIARNILDGEIRSLEQLIEARRAEHRAHWISITERRRRAVHIGKVHNN